MLAIYAFYYFRIIDKIIIKSNIQGIPGSLFMNIFLFTCLLIFSFSVSGTGNNQSQLSYPRIDSNISETISINQENAIDLEDQM